MPKSKIYALRMFCAGLIWFAAQTASAQSTSPHAPAEPISSEPEEKEAPQSAVSLDPYAAYADGRYEDAFEGFANLQVKRPKDVDLMLNVGASLYRLKDFAGAQKAWSLAAEHGDPNTRAHALYDMGNSAFQQKKLEEAVQHFQSALSLAPDDKDAKHNLRLAKKQLEAQQQSKNNQDSNAQKPPQDPNADNQSSKPSPKDPNAPGDEARQSPEDSDKGDNAQPKPKPHDKEALPNANKDAAAPGDKQDKKQDDKPGDKQDKQAAPDDASGQAPAEPDDKAQKRMPRSQAERLLDAMGESRPRHAAPKDKAAQRPADGMDW